MSAAADRVRHQKEAVRHNENVGPALEYLEQRGITETAIAKFLLGYGYKDSELAGRLTIPYLTPAGTVGIKGRCIGDHNCKEEHHAKYLYSDGSKPHLFNAQTLLSAERVIICEGEIDAVAAEMAGVPAVAYPGTQTWDGNKHWRLCFDSVSEVAVVADGDDAGRKAAKRVADSLRDVVDGAVSVIYMPEGEDTNSFLHEHGELEFMDKIGWLG